MSPLAQKVKLVRMDDEMLLKLEALSADMGTSSNQALIRCVEAIFEMLESHQPIEPAMVRAVRLMRKNDATFASQPRKILRLKPNSATKNLARTLLDMKKADD